MILEETKGKVDLSNVGSQITCGIKINKKIFSLLTKDTYQNPIKAMLRELGCNAADAMIAAGKPNEPWACHLPNRLEMYLLISDTGTGLTQDEIVKIYTIFGQSNKSDSNEFTGMFGIGSKSPLAYSDSFQITNRKDGIETTACLILNEDEIPTWVNLGSKPTTECNGLSIKVACKVGDEEKFRQEAEKVLSWFKVRPIVTGNASFRFIDTKTLYSGPGYKILDGHGYDRSAIIMGSVRYPMNYNDYTDHIGNSIVQHGIELELPIGSVDITSNRESLKYSEKTNKAIKEALVKVKQDCYKEVEKEFIACQKPWEVRKKLEKFSNTVIGKIYPVNTYKFKGQELSTKIKKEDVVKEYQSKLDPAQQFRIFWVSRKRKSSVSHPNPEVGPSHEIFINDIDRGAITRLNEYFQANAKYDCYLLENVPQQWIDDEGLGTDIKKVSILPKPAVAKRTSVRAKKAMVYKLKSAAKYYGYASSAWEAEQVDIKLGGYYVILDRFLWSFKKDGNGTSTTPKYERPEKLLDTLTNLKKITDKDIEVYGIRKADEDKLIKASPKWINFSKYIEQSVNDTKTKIIKDIINREINYTDTSWISDLKSKLGQIKHDSIVHLYYKKLKENALDSKADPNKETAWKSLNNLLTTPITWEADTKTTQDLRDKIFLKYPLLQALNYSVKYNLSSAVEYINLIDAVEIPTPKQYSNNRRLVAV